MTEGLTLLAIPEAVLGAITPSAVAWAVAVSAPARPFQLKVQVMNMEKRDNKKSDVIHERYAVTLSYQRHNTCVCVCVDAASQRGGVCVW